MKDHELDRIIADAAPVTDDGLAALDLAAAEHALMEAIMSQQDTPAGTPPDDHPVSADPPGPFPTTARHPRRAGGPGRTRTRVVAALGLVAALVVGVVFVRSSSGNDDPGTDGPADFQASDETGIAPLIADPLADGTFASMVSPPEGGAPPSQSGPTDTWVYGEVGPTAVTDDIVLRWSPAAPEGDVVGEQVTVRGVAGTFCSPGPNQCDFGNNTTGVSWAEPSGGYFEVDTRTFDRDQVLAIAEGLVIDGDTPTLGALPGGMTAPPLVAELADDWERTYMVQYDSPRGSVMLATWALEDEADRIYELWRTGPRDGTEVGGQPAWVDDIDGQIEVVWEIVPGQVAEILAYGPNEAEALAFAETVRPATPEEWAALQEEVGEANPSTPPTGEPLEAPEGALRRTLADGESEVAAWVGEDGGIHYATPFETMGGGTSAPRVRGLSPMSFDGGPVGWIYPAAVGLAPEGTATIEAGTPGPDGDAPTVGTTFGDPTDDGIPFIWEFTPGDMPATLVFLAEDGTVLAEEEVVVI